MIITWNLSQTSSIEIYNDEAKYYYVINIKQIDERRVGKLPLSIKLCTEKHIIFPWWLSLSICYCIEQISVLIKNVSEKIFVNCSHETKKQMYFNDCSDDEDSANIDLEEEIEDENNC